MRHGPVGGISDGKMKGLVGSGNGLEEVKSRDAVSGRRRAFRNQSALDEASRGKEPMCIKIPKYHGGYGVRDIVYPAVQYE